ncbi:MAG: hypothetical protein LBH40_07095 [Alphaproteobacteria bacterium]|jgi:uncharacterized protein YdeI (BOF family)|nr:hypothetical protein [Alphaproteobacteria bacterium]
MKKVLLSILILLSTSLLHATNITNINFIKNSSKNGDIFTIQGTLTANLNDNEYMFQDSSGQAKIIIKHFVLKELGNSLLPLNSEITLRIAVNKEIIEHPKFEAFEITHFNRSPTTASLNTTSLSNILKNANDHDIFTIKGTIIATTDTLDNQYQLKDEFGKIIGITVKNFAFKAIDINHFNAEDRVVLRVIYRKDTETNATWLEVYKIVELNNSTF